AKGLRPGGDACYFGAMTASGGAPSALPLVTVVIPTYNRADLLPDAIESVLAQSYKPIEIIVVDDGSTDDTRAVATRFGDRIRYVYQENAERAAARNHGLRLACGDFIAFLDSDDYWDHDKIESDVSVLAEHTGTGVVYSDLEIVDLHGRHLHFERRRGYEG